MVALQETLHRLQLNKADEATVNGGTQPNASENVEQTWPHGQKRSGENLQARARKRRMTSENVRFLFCCPQRNLMIYGYSEVHTSIRVAQHDSPMHARRYL